MAEVAYIALPLLKSRLQPADPGDAALPDPEGDADLLRIIQAASRMVADRVDPTQVSETAPPAAVQQVTLMLALRMRSSEIRQYTDEAGRPIILPLWTPDLTDILGDLIADPTPDTGAGLGPAAGVMSRTAILPSPTGWPDANAPRYAGDVYRWRLP